MAGVDGVVLLCSCPPKISVSITTDQLDRSRYDSREYLAVLKENNPENNSDNFSHCFDRSCRGKLDNGGRSCQYFYLGSRRRGSCPPKFSVSITKNYRCVTDIIMMEN